MLPFPWRKWFSIISLLPGSWLITPGNGARSGAQCCCQLLADWVLSHGFGKRKSLLSSSLLVSKSVLVLQRNITNKSEGTTGKSQTPKAQELGASIFEGRRRWISSSRRKFTFLCLFFFFFLICPFESVCIPRKTGRFLHTFTRQRSVLELRGISLRFCRLNYGKRRWLLTLKDCPLDSTSPSSTFYKSSESQA